MKQIRTRLERVSVTNKRLNYMSGLTELSLKELYNRRESLENEMYAELSMDASGDCQDSIVDLFQPKIQQIEDEIDSRSELKTKNCL